jgi:hypothetical protein
MMRCAWGWVAAALCMAARGPEYQTRSMEGWTVTVRQELLDEKSEVGREALRLLQAKLYDVGRAVPPKACAELRKVPIWLGIGEGTGAGAEYHPSEAWLREHGHDPRKAKAVEIGDAAKFLKYAVPQPSMLIHELAHAYHDRVLGFDHAGIKAAYAAALQGKKYESVLHIDGGRKRHYALTDPKEYFAEASEAWFGTNDFYPFVRWSLREVDPDVCKVLEEVWVASPVTARGRRDQL